MPFEALCAIDSLNVNDSSQCKPFANNLQGASIDDETGFDQNRTVDSTAETFFEKLSY